MALYLAYGLVVMHVSLGAMQFNRTPFLPLMLVGGFASVSVLHLLAAARERVIDQGTAADQDGWLRVGAPQSIPDKGARIVAAPGGERTADFRDGTPVAA